MWLFSLVLRALIGPYALWENDALQLANLRARYVEDKHKSSFKGRRTLADFLSADKKSSYVG